MDAADDRSRRIFFELHQDLPREAPGNRASTERALGLVAERLPASTIRRVLDVGCGPGQQTLDLAALLPRAGIIAVDLHASYLAEVRRRAAGAGLAARIAPVRADMGRLPIAPASIDLAWCEGAAYIVGLQAALAAWRPLLRGGGAVAFTDAVWLGGDRPERAQAFWAEYPGMTDRAGVLAQLERAGFEPRSPFVLPSEAWWDDYYRPLAARIDLLAWRYVDDPVAQRVLEAHREEIDLFRAHGDCYGYAFFVGHRAAR
ncbi:MAG: class I SAM-dependent methyltransferase [Pseudomonadales bacterium]